METISPASPLPDVTDTVTIDGYTQPGASPNTLSAGTDAVLLVELNGQNAGQALGIKTKASDSVARGLAINRFSASGISIEGGTGARVEGNFIGTDPSGSFDRGNGGGGVIVSHGTENIVGGDLPEARNVISGNGEGGIGIFGGTAVGNEVLGNLIGTKKSGNEALANSSHGVFVLGASKNTIGGTTPEVVNAIAFNDGDGVNLAGAVDDGRLFIPTGNRILSNSIFSNVEEGIDLNNDGPNANDAKDSDAGPNDLQNFPVLTEATVFGSQVTVEGTINSTPSTKHKKKKFTVQFFSSPQADPSSFGEGRKFIGQETVTTDRRGDRSFSFTFAPVQTISPGEKITATATRNFTGDTSEFSVALQVLV